MTEKETEKRYAQTEEKRITKTAMQHTLHTASRKKYGRQGNRLFSDIK
jgi:hypothetical protein